MSRSGYSDDCDGPALAMWRGAVASAIRGKRGQAFLAELLAALDALPKKRLGAHALRTEDGDFCAIGAVGAARGMDLAAIDPEDREAVAAAFGIAPAMAAEIMFENDDDFHYWQRQSPQARWLHVRTWVVASMTPNVADERQATVPR